MGSKKSKIAHAEHERSPQANWTPLCNRIRPPTALNPLFSKRKRAEYSHPQGFVLSIKPRNEMVKHVTPSGPLQWRRGYSKRIVFDVTKKDTNIFDHCWPGGCLQRTFRRQVCSETCFCSKGYRELTMFQWSTFVILRIRKFTFTTVGPAAKEHLLFAVDSQGQCLLCDVKRRGWALVESRNVWLSKC